MKLVCRPHTADEKTEAQRRGPFKAKPSIAGVLSLPTPCFQMLSYVNYYLGWGLTVSDSNLPQKGPIKGRTMERRGLESTEQGGSEADSATHYLPWAYNWTEMPRYYYYSDHTAWPGMVPGYACFASILINSFFFHFPKVSWVNDRKNWGGGPYTTVPAELLAMCGSSECNCILLLPSLHEI